MFTVTGKYHSTCWKKTTSCTFSPLSVYLSFKIYLYIVNWIKVKVSSHHLGLFIFFSNKGQITRVCFNNYFYKRLNICGYIIQLRVDLTRELGLTGEETVTMLLSCNILFMLICRYKCYAFFKSNFIIKKNYFIIKYCLLYKI